MFNKSLLDWNRSLIDSPGWQSDYLRNEGPRISAERAAFLEEHCFNRFLDETLIGVEVAIENHDRAARNEDCVEVKDWLYSSFGRCQFSYRLDPGLVVLVHLKPHFSEQAENFRQEMWGLVQEIENVRLKFKSIPPRWRCREPLRPALAPLLNAAHAAALAFASSTGVAIASRCALGRAASLPAGG